MVEEKQSDGPKSRIQSGKTQSTAEGSKVPPQRVNPNTGRMNRKRAPQVRKVNDFIIFMDEVLGEGQYGKVCKA